MEALQAVLVLAAVFCVYLFPWIVAKSCGHRQSDAILVINLLFGWTFLGWGVALVWAMLEDKR